MFIADGVSTSFVAMVGVSAVVVLCCALRRSRQNEQRARDVSLLLMAQCGHLVRSEIQAQETARASSVRLDHFLAENQRLKTEIGTARGKAAEVEGRLAEERETVRILTDKLNAASVRLDLLLVENQHLKTEVGAAQDKTAELEGRLAEERETVRMLTDKLNPALFELDQRIQDYALMKKDLKREAAAAASHETAHVYWKAEAKRLRGSVDKLNSEIAQERAAEVQSGIAEAAVTHVFSLATGG